MQKNTIIGLVIVVAMLIGGYYMFSASKARTNNYNKINPNSTSNTSVVPVKTNTNTGSPSSSVPVDSNSTNSVVYNKATVSNHNSKSDCWSIVSGNVYDLTSWIARHPGGQSAIISMCGIDATASFMDQHGGQGRPEYELSKYLLGPLVK